MKEILYILLIIILTPIALGIVTFVTAYLVGLVFKLIDDVLDWVRNY